LSYVSIFLQKFALFTFGKLCEPKKDRGKAKDTKCTSFVSSKMFNCKPNV